jgi:hypothetical protein
MYSTTYCEIILTWLFSLQSSRNDDETTYIEFDWKYCYIIQKSIGLILSQLRCSLSVAIYRPVNGERARYRRRCLIIFCPWMTMNVLNFFSFKKMNLPPWIRLSFFFYSLCNFFGCIVGLNCAMAVIVPLSFCLYTQCRTRFSNRQDSDVRKKWTNDEEEDGAITVLFSLSCSSTVFLSSHTFTYFPSSVCATISFI